MRENTFDVPAYKFFVVKIDDDRDFHELDDYEFLLNNNLLNNIKFIPFENIDGLEVEIVKRILKTKEIFLLGAIVCKKIKTATYFDKQKETNDFYDYKAVYFDESQLDKNYKKTVDKLWEEYMERNYLTSDDYTKRMYRCFFERYQDGSYEKTKERIRKLEIGK